jgi:hypothetical protein
MTTISIVLAASARRAARLPAERGLVESHDVHLQLVEVHAATLAEAIDRGLSQARGDIVGCLGERDSLLPGVLPAIAAAVSTHRPVVLGRTLLRLEGFDTAPVRHASEYRDRVDHLCVWRRGFNSVPLASLFWHRTAIAALGSLRGMDAAVMEYEIACRLGARHAIAAIDADWSVRHVALESAPSDPEVLHALIRASRSHWGSWLGLRRWQCERSYRSWRFQSHDHARHHARLAEQAQAAGDAARARKERMLTAIYSREMARGRFGKD